MHEKRLNAISNEDQVIISQQTCLLCPCPQLTAYWTQPPSCPRRVCENSAKIQPFSIFRDSKTSCIFFLTILLAYYLIMDIILFMRFRTVDMVEDSTSGSPDEIYSPFTHLSVKAIMNDQTSQYVVNPLAEYFDMITRFSSIFSFITPNMISITHLILAFIAGKFIASENLNDRRVGVVIFQIRVWLDTYDGVVYRAHAGKHLMYQSLRTSLGYYVDMICDTLGGTFLCFGLLFHLFKRFDSSRQELPTFLIQDLTSKLAVPTNGHTPNSRESYSKKYLFWKTFCFGICLACAGKFWDLAVADFESVFQVPKDPKVAVLQFEMSHSTPTVVIIYLWRIVEAQALLQYILFIIVVDKVWEFLNYTQYILLIMIVCLYLATLIYVHHVRSVLHL